MYDANSQKNKFTSILMCFFQTFQFVAYRARLLYYTQKSIQNEFDEIHFWWPLMDSLSGYNTRAQIDMQQIEMFGNF